MLPIGFSVGGVNCGLVKNKNDLSIFISETYASVAGVFTKNIIKAAPVIVDIAKIEKKDKFFGIIVNSGCANSCTGYIGEKKAEHICYLVEKIFNVPKNSILCASTGVIGQNFSISDSEFEKGIKLLKNNIGNSLKNENDAIYGIMTTDTLIKKVSKKIKVKNGEINIWGCVKGSGMIHPMLKGYHATMLSFILTDAKIDSIDLQKILEYSVENSFNCITVDGDTSTNDTIVAFANGKSCTGELKGEDLKIFSKAFDYVTLSLAKLIIKDAEGSSKFIEICVKNAKTREDAKLISSTIATSVLFKTAMFGADANWGRILAAAGRSGVEFDFTKIDIKINEISVLKNGIAINFSEKNIKNTLLKEEISVVVDLKVGEEMCKYYTCDLSYDYVKINSNYRS
jgi:glutamate N-acetyltransferase/amino-acid N-acetyltransferase